jgi:Fur family peroxide stress response transcriptional regulator
MRKYSKKQMVKALKEAGYRMTQQRLAVIDMIATRSDHPSARQIYLEIQKRETSISLATIYNTLNTLVHKKLIKELDFEYDENRYDTNVKPHINLICTRCGSISDFNLDLPMAKDEITVREEFIITDYRIEYHGICTQCSRKKE